VAEFRIWQLGGKNFPRFLRRTTDQLDKDKANAVIPAPLYQGYWDVIDEKKRNVHPDLSRPAKGLSAGAVTEQYLQGQLKSVDEKP
jgi:hypothetical protein